MRPRIKLTQSKRITLAWQSLKFAAPGKLERELSTIKKTTNGNQTELF